MPSPIAHVSAGYCIYRYISSKRKALTDRRAAFAWKLFLFIMIISVLPDTDSIVGVLSGDMGRFHNNLTHSLFTGLTVSIVTAMLAWMSKLARPGPAFRLTLICYWVHIALDYMTYGRGVMAFWPLTSSRFRSPLLVFFGFHWSEGLFSVSHIWTAAGELLTSAIIIALVYRLTAARKSPENSTQDLK